LPRLVEADRRADGVIAALADTKLLWAGGEMRAPVADLTEPLRRALKSAHSAGRVIRGLESAEKKLDAELRGMDDADRRSGATRGQRISRLLLVSADGAERMYRRLETLLRRNPGRLLVLQVRCGSDELGSLLYGPKGTAKLLMLDHKDAVADALLALAAPSAEPEPSSESF
jgi:hypothetical protein